MSGYYYNNPAEGIFVGVVVVIMLIFVGLCFAVYVLRAVGQMRMAQKCGIDKPWLAFIPVASAYNLGLIAEKYNDGKPTVKKYSRILLGLNIAYVAGNILYYAVRIISYVSEPFLTLGGAADGDNALAGAGLMLICVLLSLIYLALMIVVYVVTYIALYRAFCIFAPDNAAVFLVLSILFSIALPIIMLAVSSKYPVSLRRDDMPGANINQ